MKPDNQDNLADAGTTPDNSHNEDGEIIFTNEAANLQNNRWFSPDPGTTRVTFLDNGRMETRTYDGEEKPVGVFQVEVDGDELQWSVTKGSSETSLWGQLMKLGAHKDGLKGETITLIRSGTGNDTTYTVQEAADL